MSRLLAQVTEQSEYAKLYDPILKRIRIQGTEDASEVRLAAARPPHLPLALRRGGRRPAPAGGAGGGAAARPRAPPPPPRVAVSPSVGVHKHLRRGEHSARPPRRLRPKAAGCPPAARLLRSRLWLLPRCSRPRSAATAGAAHWLLTAPRPAPRCSCCTPAGRAVAGQRRPWRLHATLQPALLRPLRPAPADRQSTTLLRMDRAAPCAAPPPRFPARQGARSALVPPRSLRAAAPAKLLGRVRSEQALRPGRQAPPPAPPAHSPPIRS